MSNWFNLELDTTAPDLNIIAPNYTIYNIHTIITIESNEDLMNFQEVYLIDALGIRHDLIFSYQTNSFYGDVIFNETYNIGIATLYVRLKDSVSNLSSLVSKTINIFESNVLTLDVFDFSREIKRSEKKRELQILNNKKFSVNLKDNNKSFIILTSKSMNIDIETITRKIVTETEVLII